MPVHIVDVPLTKLDYPLTKMWKFAPFVALACGGSAPQTGPASSPPSPSETVEASADVVGVSVTGTEGAWTFSVTVRSDDLGCERYADWWEVITPDGDLVYRRILRHSHVDEQPFTRASESPIALMETDEVYVRAHLSPGGYVGSAYVGSADAGFTEADLEVGFADDLEAAAPLPDGCLY